MNKSKLLQLSVLAGLLFIPAWCKTGTGLILLFAFIPLLFVEDYLFENKVNNRPHKAFLYSALTFLIWNAGTTWWLWNATIAGMFLAFFINTLLMSTIFWLFHLVRRNTHSALGYFALIAFWLVYEHFYMYGEINWPWLNLGNGFANDILFIQWYEYTGTFGGTFWVLLTNVLGFNLLKHYINHKNLRVKRSQSIILLTLVLLPIIASLTMFGTYREKEDPKEIVVIQPNIDPYLEKFGGMGMDRQMNILMNLADSLTTPETDFIVVPETFINDNIWEENLYTNDYVKRIYRFLMEDNPKASFIVGMTFYKLYKSAAEKSKTAQEMRGRDTWFDSYNAAMQIDTSLNKQVYIKSMLVVGVEKMPYVHSLRFLRKLTLKLGGTFRSHGVQEERSNFYTQTDSTGTSPVICWESVFGEYVTGYIKKGSDLIFIVTNDGWWGNTPGHRQHNSFARLRAIENRRSVARSANTGISSFINQRGEIQQRTNYWEEDALIGTLNKNDKLTFYTRHGDYIARIAYFFSLLIVLYTITRFIIQRKK